MIEGFSERNLITAAILVMVNPYQGRVPYLYLRAHKIVLKKPNPTMNRTAVSIVEVTNIKERDLIQFNTEVNFFKKIL